MDSEETEEELKVHGYYSPDTNTDLNCRTALHYSYALTHGHRVTKLLNTAGASDHTLDKVFGFKNYYFNVIIAVACSD